MSTQICKRIALIGLVVALAGCASVRQTVARLSAPALSHGPAPKGYCVDQALSTPGKFTWMEPCAPQATSAGAIVTVTITDLPRSAQQPDLAAAIGSVMKTDAKPMPMPAKTGQNAYIMSYKKGWRGIAALPRNRVALITTHPYEGQTLPGSRARDLIAAVLAPMMGAASTPTNAAPTGPRPVARPASLGASTS